jgi:hypothetical protein
MTVFILSGLFMGGLIGTRLTVLALLPAAACTVGIAATVSMLGPGAHDWTARDVTALLVFQQIGYLCGASVRVFLLSSRKVGERKRLRSS